MRRTVGYHVVKSGYGLWLPGDERGHWSSAWDDELGHVGPHTLHRSDPVRERMAEERLKHPPVRFDDKMIRAIAAALGECADRSPWSIVAASIESTHVHLLLTYSEIDIDRTLKWISQCTTKHVHTETDHRGPVWARGKWRSFIFDQTYWLKSIRYIERHNLRRGLEPSPYAFITPVE